MLRRLCSRKGRSRSPITGYYFRILKAQGPDAQGGVADYVVKGQMIGGFALVAFPAEYDVSGVKTFLVNHEGVVYAERPRLTDIHARSCYARFNPGKGWKAVEGE